MENKSVNNYIKRDKAHDYFNYELIHTCKQTGIIEYNKDGAVDSFGVYEYDKDGNILVSSYDKDGNLTDVSKQLNNDINVLYDTNGKYQHGYKTEYTEDSNGNIKSHKDYCWSRKGNLLKR